MPDDPYLSDGCRIMSVTRYTCPVDGCSNSYLTPAALRGHLAAHSDAPHFTAQENPE